MTYFNETSMEFIMDNNKDKEIIFDNDKCYYVYIKKVQDKIKIFQNDELLDEMEMTAPLKRIFERRNIFKGLILKYDSKHINIRIIRYCDLHRHSGYSLLDGAITIKDMVKNTEFGGALTDHGVMFATLDYYKKMKNSGKKPILGFEAYCESINGEKERNHLILLAKNLQGYNNLKKLTSLGYYNFYNKPHISYELLKKYSNGVIATSACIGGEIPKLLRAGKEKEAKKVALKLKKIFKDDFYIEIQRHNFDEELRTEPKLIKLAKDLNIKLIATTDAHYLNKEDAFSQEILLCLQTKKTLNEPHFKFQGEGYYIHNSAQMVNKFKDIPEALDNTLEIEEKCDIELDLTTRYMPHFPIPIPYKDEASYFEYLCMKGFKKRFGGTNKEFSQEYIDRINFEIKVIKNMGFPGYFIIVWDYIRFANEKGIYVGPGRGSAVGSLVSYCLGITALDPIQYGLLFERFLNPDRVTMPDIDIDFEFERREEVINYVREKYGHDCVSKIITFGTMGAKMVVRDVARVYEYDKKHGYKCNLGDIIAKAIPTDIKMTLKKALKESSELREIYESNKDVKTVIDASIKLEGLPRHCSQHACGIVIAPSTINDYIPTILLENKETKEKEVTCQFIMSEVEEMGLLKMDFLGLRTMGVIGRCLEKVNEKRGKECKEKLKYMDIPFDDKKVYEFISKGNTFGVFQLESQGMTSFMQQLYQDVESIPDNEGEQLFERLIAGISLYRPGPIDEIPNYINNMLSPNNIHYELPELKSILEPTYNVIVYQEQCMHIVRALAGFSRGDADNVRKAFAKKKQDMIEPLGKKFINGQIDENNNVITPGCLRNNIKLETAIDLWSKMESFGSYAFNKSHACGYAVIAYITAWLAYYYPTEFMTEILNSFILNADKLQIYLSACRKKNIEVLQADINESNQNFTTLNNCIRFGLMGIKGLGKSSQLIIQERSIRGMFKNYQDFAERMAKHQKVDKKVIEGLIYSGALDSFEGTRRAKISILEKILKNASLEKKNFISGQIDIFSLSDDLKKFKKINTPALDEFSKKFKLEKEKEYAGFYLTEHPIDDYVKYFENEGVYQINEIMPNQSMSLDDDNMDEFQLKDTQQSEVTNFNKRKVKIAGIIKNLKTVYTKKENKIMYIFSIEDREGEIGAVVFNKNVELNQDKLIEGKIIVADGMINQDDKGIQIFINTLYDIENMKQCETPKCIWIRAFNNKQMQQVLDIVKSNKGSLTVNIKFNDKNFKCNTGFEFNYSNFIKLQEAIGTQNVKIIYNK